MAWAEVILSSLNGCRTISPEITAVVSARISVEEAPTKNVNDPGSIVAVVNRVYEQQPRRVYTLDAGKHVDMLSKPSGKILDRPFAFVPRFIEPGPAVLPERSAAGTQVQGKSHERTRASVQSSRPKLSRAP